MPHFEGNRGTKTILGNREHKKTNFRFLGNRGTSQFISGEQGNRYPPGRASILANCVSYVCWIISTKAKSFNFGLSLSLLPYFMYANNRGSSETVRMCRLVWALAFRHIGCADHRRGGGGVLWYFHTYQGLSVKIESPCTYVVSGHFWGFKILSFNTFYKIFRKLKIFWGYEDFVDFLGVVTKLDYIYG